METPGPGGKPRPLSHQWHFPATPGGSQGQAREDISLQFWICYVSAPFMSRFCPVMLHSQALSLCHTHFMPSSVNLMLCTWCLLHLRALVSKLLARLSNPLDCRCPTIHWSHLKLSSRLHACFMDLPFCLLFVCSCSDLLIVIITTPSGPWTLDFGLPLGSV